MYHKGIVMEIKQQYCLVLNDDQEIVRLYLKKGLKKGLVIYYLDEDIYEAKADIPSTKPWLSTTVKRVLVSTLTILLLFYLGIHNSSSFIPSAYAAVSFSTSKNLQVVLDENYEIIKADSFDHTIANKDLEKLHNQKLAYVKEIIDELIDDENPLLIGYALYDDGHDDNLSKLLVSIFGNTDIIYVYGKGNDIHHAKDQNINLGDYILTSYDYEEMEDVIEDMNRDELKAFISSHKDCMNDEEIQEAIHDRKEDLEEDDVDDDKENQDHDDDKESDKDDDNDKEEENDDNEQESKDSDIDEDDKDIDKDE